MSEESDTLKEQSSRDAKYQSIRNFYLTYLKVNALRSELSWTHYRLLLWLLIIARLEFVLLNNTIVWYENTL